MIRTAAAFLLLAIPLAAQASDKQLLRYHLQEGSVLHYVLDSSTALNMQQDERQMQSGMQMQLWVEFRIGAVRAGKAEVSQTFYRLKATMDVPGSKLEFDSDDPTSNPGMLAQMKGVLGKTFKMQIDDRGRVSDVQLPEGSKDELMKTLGGGELDKFFAQYFPQLPEAALAIGDTWDVASELAMGQMGKTKLTVHNKLARVVAGKAVLEQTMEVEFEAGKMPMVMKLVESKGAAEIDLAAFLTGSSLQLKMTGGALRPDGGKLAADMDVRMAMRTVEAPSKK